MVNARHCKAAKHPQLFIRSSSAAAAVFLNRLRKDGQQLG
jgi:hypothetical protein